MRSLRSTIVCIAAATTAVGAFQPMLSGQRSTLSSSIYSSASSASSTAAAVDTLNETKSPVTVVDFNEPKTAQSAATTAYLASLEHTVRGTDSSVPAPPTNTAVPVDAATQETAQLSAPLQPTKEKPSTSTGVKKGLVTIATTIQELLNVMDGNCDGDNGVDDALTLVLFHAHYCKICQRAGIQLNKAAKEYPSVNFAKVESQVFPEPAADNLRTLGVSKFPFIQIYRKGQCVASFSTGPTHMFMKKVRDTLDLCLERDEDCWNGFVTEFAEPIESNQSARRNLGPMP
jgi:thiol-disulfide isomerase/thioredoxin